MNTAVTTVGTDLRYAGMAHRGMGFGFDLQMSHADKSTELYLCVGRADNRVALGGTTPLTRQPAVLAAIDAFGRWGVDVDTWLVAEKASRSVAQTAAVKYRTHVKPFCGALRIRDFAADTPRLTYPGNGVGRLLSKPINGRYYFVHGGRLESDTAMRGFDCTSFPMALLSIPRLADPKYGKQLCEAVQAKACGLEQIKRADLEQRFKADSIPIGIYVLFSSAHVLLYNADMNVLHEFTHGGYRATHAENRPMPAPNGLWWMRKLDDSYRKAFV